jgi:hypothetical protein
MEKKINIRVESDGTPTGTKVFDIETGLELNDVISVGIEVNENKEFTNIKIELIKVPPVVLLGNIYNHIKIDDDYINRLILEAQKKRLGESISTILKALNYRYVDNKPHAILIINQEIYNEWIKTMNPNYTGVINRYITYDEMFEIRVDKDEKDISLKFYWEEGDLMGLSDIDYIKSKFQF